MYLSPARLPPEHQDFLFLSIVIVDHRFFFFCFHSCL
uniref:Uncharacterized protein n=1 Tax=Scytodes thoracica TaxID=1112478 RepID=A0A0A0VCQ4_SCYTH|nr:hypothetical protein [Scytodes thoracica]